MSTSFINLVFIPIILLSGCASQESMPDKLSPQSIDQAVKATTESDIEKYRHAITLISSGDLDKAEAELMEFAEDHPELAGPWANLGLISIKRNKLEKAEELLHKALKRNPDMPQAYNLLGFIEKSRNNIIKARDYYIKAVELKSNYTLAHYNLALLYDVYIQDIAKAVAHYQKYMTLIENKDKKTADWLDQLKASLKKG